jgi:flagellar basal-body rod protein FlgF
MDRGLFDAARSMNIKMKNMEIVANNLANVNTTGYKREVPFSEYLSRMENKPLKQLSSFEQGNLVQTDNPLSLAITGNAFFMIKTDRGIELTRNGNFMLTKEGDLVTQDGYPVVTQGGTVNLFEEQLNSKKDKTIAITDNGEIKYGNEIIDKLLIAKTPDQHVIERDKGSRFINQKQEYVIANESDYKVHQGFLEESNTNPFQEMQAMINLNKEFETAQRTVQSIDTILGQAKEIGKT